MSFRYWLAPKLGGGPRTDSGERAGGPLRMRLALEELGGAWVKLGQMLAMRFDLLPAAYGDEMFKLLNQVRPFPYTQVREWREEARAARRRLPMVGAQIVHHRLQ